jgi:hypothetical protein
VNIYIGEREERRNERTRSVARQAFWQTAAIAAFRSNTAAGGAAAPVNRVFRCFAVSVK